LMDADRTLRGRYLLLSVLQSTEQAPLKQIMAGTDRCHGRSDLEEATPYVQSSPVQPSPCPVIQYKPCSAMQYKPCSVIHYNPCPSSQAKPSRSYPILYLWC
jgi:hypothetical protein